MISIEDAQETLFADLLMEQEPGYSDWLFGKITRTIGRVADGTAKLTEHSDAMGAMKGRLRSQAVERRIVGEIESLPPFPERVRESDRVPGSRELVVNKLPYVISIQLLDDSIIVLNILHTRKKFPT